MNGRGEADSEGESDLSEQDLEFFGTPGTSSSFISGAKVGYEFMQRIHVDV